MSNRSSQSTSARRALLFVILFSALALQSTTLIAGQANVTSLPLDLTTHSADLWDTVTLNGTRLDCATGITHGTSAPVQQYALWINTDYIYVKLDNDTLAYGTANGSNQAGIAVWTGRHHVVIDGGYILHSPTGILANDNADPAWTGSEPVRNATCIRLAGGTHDIEIKNIRKAIVKGYADNSASQIAGVIAGGSYNINIHNNDSLINSCYAYQQRDLFEAPVYTATAGASSLVGGATYNFRFAHNVCLDKAHTALFFYRTSNSDPIIGLVDSNQITLDVRNNQYTSIGSLYLGCANSYAIQFTGAGPGTKIRGNRIRSGTRYLGGQGIHMVGSQGTGYRQIEIAYNNIETHQGFETEFGDAFHPVAVKLRQRLYGLWLHHDTIVYVTDTMRSINVHGQAYAPQGHAIQVQQWDVAGTPQYVTIENCYIATRVVTNNITTNLYATEVVNFEDWVGTPNPEMIWQYNRLHSEGAAVYGFGQGGDGGAAYMTVFRDTIDQVVQPFSAYQKTFVLGTVNSSYAYNEIARDLYYGNGTSPTSVVYASGRDLTASHPHDISIERTLNINVKGGLNSRPVSGATVTVTNAYGQLVATGTTSSIGVYNPIVTYRRDFMASPDSFAFNNFTFAASKGTDHSSKTFTVNWNAFTDTVTLAATSGDSTSADNTPPNQIMDLGALPGSSSTSINLAWTAPGDDGTSGTATTYDIRYSISNITANNFASAAQASGEPAPRSAGSSESFTVTNLNPNTTYYFAIRSADEAPNWSTISNVVSRTTTTTADQISPGAIADLSAQTGVADGELVLGWTAPGDDGATGTAYQYAIRYSTAAITVGNWGAATPVSAPPAPLTAGSQQNLTLGGLSPGVLYYVAIITQDEAGNLSPLSNIPSGRAKLTVITGDSSAVTIVEPTDYAVVGNVRPTLVILNHDTVLSNTYSFLVAADSLFNDLVAVSGAVPQQDGLQTSWQVSPALQTNQDYYWRVSLNSGAFGPYAAFTVDVETRAYPNPFRLAETNQVTFTGVPAGSSLILLSASGDLVRRWSGSNGSDIMWDGRNESGQGVASGVYMWYVESSDIKGKLIVIR